MGSVDLESWRIGGLLVDAASGLLYLLLGVFVALVKPRRALNAAFGTFGIFFGLLVFCENVYGVLGNEALPLRALRHHLQLLFFIVAVVALVLVAFWFPRPLARTDRYLLRSPIIIAAVYVVAHVADILQDVGSSRNDYWWYTSWSSLNFFLFATTAFGLALFARRFDGSDRPRDAAQFAFVSAALILYPSINAGITLTYVATGEDSWASSSFTAVLMASIAALWLRNAHRAAAGTGTSARILAILPFAGILSGFMLASAFGADLAYSLGLLGLARTAGVLLLAYAILRHELFDIDLRIKWTLQRGTLLAIFLIVFFVIANVASEFLTSSYGFLTGGIAAGLLLFLISPIQRFAEGIAERAMPGVRDTDEYRRVRKQEVYRSAVEAAAADGAITEREREILSRLQDQLGLKAAEAFSIERAVSRPSPN